MSCFKPMFIRLSKPIASTGEILEGVNVPCGKCSECIKRRRMEWAFRMDEEMKESKTCYFVTLTYSPENVPWDRYGNMILLKTSLDAKKNFRSVKGLKEVKDKYLRKMKMKKHGFVDKSAQGFVKRMRVKQERIKHVTREAWFHRLVASDKMKFFLCGEYGERFGRPHMHMIVFNGVEECIRDAWGYRDDEGNFVSFGDVQVVKATRETIMYCTKYMDKWKDKKQDWKKPREFNTQSEAIGVKFVEKMMKFYKKNLEINYVVNGLGFKVAMPRYFRLKMLSEEERARQVFLIEKEMRRLKQLEIDTLGLDWYNVVMKNRIDFSNIKFRKDSKRRDM